MRKKSAHTLTLWSCTIFRNVSKSYLQHDMKDEEKRKLWRTSSWLSAATRTTVRASRLASCLNVWDNVESIKEMIRLNVIRTVNVIEGQECDETVERRVMLDRTAQTQSYIINQCDERRQKQNQTNNDCFVLATRFLCVSITPCRRNVCWMRSSRKHSGIYLGHSGGATGVWNNRYFVLRVHD